MNKKRRKLNLNYKIWLETDDKAFGEGPCDILLKVEKHGSLKGAAEEMGMSYSHAWNLVKKLEGQLGFKLLYSQVGGVCGGGASLTPEARELLNRYQEFMKEASEVLDQIFKKHFR